MEDLERNVRSAASRADRWANVQVVQQAAENADTPVESRAKWTKIYALFGANSESEQDEVFAAVNYYFLRNGASPSGKYAKPIRTAGGVETQAGNVVQITGRLEGEVRQFLRGRLLDSYTFLKKNPAIKDDPELVAIAENAGVPRGMCWLLADWLGKDCPYFVGQEAEVYKTLRTSKIAAANIRREMAPTAVDRVRESAPETKMVASAPRYNEDLF